ncbi:uncharacterized protein LOC132200310 [Neocloeon triangulifer]|uniref:uncharacterized protein LOC132200310 n=1 Tax=Neocloeon triangulifer TaxID=2078957 RepID=UPI00286F0596|nr:uncharacterized protein LOC132200310 [Neocloeon triangulifer]
MGLSTGAGAKFALAWAVSAAIIFNDVHGQNTTSRAYCFQFTWLGPEFTEESTVNGTCNDMDNKPSVCVDPLVYTNDGTFPNTTNMWEDADIRSRVTCRLAKNEVCAKWTFTYNNQLENVTYLCTKVTEDNKYAVRSGCRMQEKEGRQIEVCICTTPVGLNNLAPPCNEAALRSAAPLLLFAVGVVLALLTR